MRKCLLVLIFMGLLVVPCMASVTGTILGTAQDENGSIVVKTAYYLDGVNVPSRYPVENGVYYWVTRYSFQNFDGMDAKGIEARVQQDVDQFAQSLIAKKFSAEENAKVDLSKIVGKTFTSETAEIQLSATKALTVATDGTAVPKVLVPPTPEKTTAELIAEVKTAIAEVKAEVTTAEAVKP
jgi:hypothetical protein